MTSDEQPRFADRGVIEGFYGSPWTHEQRLNLLPFLADRGMNAFVYSPKDDPLVRHEWRTPYAGEDLARMSELVRRGREAGVDVAWCLSPGLSIRYSSEADAAALIAKLESVAALGVTWFGLLLDDIPGELQHPDDRAAFGDLVDAQIALIGRVFAWLGPGRRLIVCPTQYHGQGDEESIGRLGQAIDPRIDLFWTGRRIVSPTIDLLDAATFFRSTGRPVTWWDNYPVNDVAMSHELHIGPYRGRDRHLYRFSRGVIANGMELYESSKIPYATIADYLNDPEGYDPERSWAAAIRDVAGEADAEAFALFADNVRSSALSEEDAPILTHALEAFTFELEHGAGAPEAAPPLAALAGRMLAAAGHLLRGPVANPALVAECRPWIEAFETGAMALACLADLAAEGRLDDEASTRLGPYLDELRAAGVRVFGDTLTMMLTDVTTTRPRRQRAATAGGGSR
jgi:hyaluronoglucosaminidase